MDKKFTSGDMPLGDLLDQARDGELQLPDFQRGWVWDDNHITSLLASVSLSYPIGAVMTLETGNADVKLKARPLEGVALPDGAEPRYLLLDGQQRATSLYLALRSGAPVPTRDARKNEMRRRYFADLARCIDVNADREEAIFSVPADGLVKNFRGEVTLDVSTLDQQIRAGEAGMFPLDIVLNYAETMAWQMRYLGAGDTATRLSAWMAFNEAIINPFVTYRVPTIALNRSTPKEAVCQVFEKVNTGGVELTVFELLTATYAADNFNLRDDWTARSATWADQPLLDEFRATDFLQVVTLLSTRARRAVHLASMPDDDRAPAVSAKRREMLRLPLQDYQQWTAPVTAALPRLVRFLHSEHIFRARDLPYTTQLVPLAAIMVALGDQADSYGVAAQLRQWYWCGVFGELYSGTTETRFANDLQDVAAWITTADVGEPRTVRDSQFQSGRLLRLRTRNSAAYKGMYALQMKHGARDFRTGLPIDVHAYLEDAIDIHHIFPQKWCVANDITDATANSVVNKTALDAKTNRRIGGNAPSRYLATVESAEKISRQDLDAILTSHDIDPLALRRDDFPAFFNARYERLLRQIEAATGKQVNRPADGSGSPFADLEADQSAISKRIADVIAAGESKVVEFKSTGRKSLRTGEKDPAMEWNVVKSLAGFMNGHGGTLLVGVADDGTALGIEEDYKFLRKQDADGWELWVTDLLSTTLGKAAAADMLVTLGDVDGHTVARIDVGPAARPVFATSGKGGEKRPVFLVRINNSTQELTGQEAHEYQRARWPDSSR
ncbi:MAG: GmrSD restriction endonuclease domain-containing protein [Streptosporangiaceae bacterium]